MLGSARNAPFVWTHRALELTEVLGSAHAGSPIRVLVFGEPGVGKRTAVDQALSLHPGRGDLVILRGSADHFRRPYSPLAEAFSALLEQADRRDRLKREAATLGTDLVTLVPFVEDAGGEVRELSSRPIYDRAPETLDSADLLYRLQRVLRLLAQTAHPMVVLADVHEYDSSTLTILRQLVRRTGLDCSFILTWNRYHHETDARDERALLAYENELLFQLGFTGLDLVPFTMEETRKFASASLDEALLSEELVLRLQRRTGGNPLFLRELLLYLLQEATFGSENPQHLLESYVSDLLPDSIRSLIALRLSELPSELREVVELASVIGVEFTSRPISEGLRIEHIQVLGRLRRLELAYNLVYELDSSHRFSLEAIRDSVYETLGSALAREHHLMLARYFEKNPTAADSHYLTSYHYERGGDLAKAASNLIVAAYDARAQRSHEEAAHRFRRAGHLAVRCLTHDAGRLAELAFEEAFSEFLAGRFEEALEGFSSLLATQPNSTLGPKAVVYCALSDYLRDRPERALERLAKLEMESLAISDPDTYRRALLARSSILYALGRWEEAKTSFSLSLRSLSALPDTLVADTLKRVNMFYLPDFALPMLEDANARLSDSRDDPLYWEVAHNIGANYFITGDLLRAEEHFKASLEAFERLGTYRVTYPINNLGLISLVRGDLGIARERFQTVLSIGKLDFDVMSARCHLALIDCLSGHPESAISELEALNDKAKDMSEMILRELLTHNLAWALSLSGRSDESIRILEQNPVIVPDLWCGFRQARRERFLIALSDGVLRLGEVPVQNKPDLLTTTGRKDSWTFKNMDYEVNELWFWE